MCFKLLGAITFAKFIIKEIKTCFDTPKEFFLTLIDKACLSLTGKLPGFSARAHVARLVKKYKTNDGYAIKDIHFPLLGQDEESGFFVGVFEDTFTSYVYFNDSYSEEIVDLYDLLTEEGGYGLVNDKVNVTVEPGDIVIDAGSWIGDFAAYASFRGASAIYAFEPGNRTFQLLTETSKINKNIIPVKKGLSDENIKANFIISGTASTFMTEGLEAAKNPSVEEVAETITLDEFVKENNIERVDFIKSDIEGFERNMLKGAQETLRKFAPKLALCTYHLPDDPEVMEALIKQANPNYNIVHKRKKLYASVPK